MNSKPPLLQPARRRRGRAPLQRPAIASAVWRGNPPLPLPPPPFLPHPLAWYHVCFAIAFCGWRWAHPRQAGSWPVACKPPAWVALAFTHAQPGGGQWIGACVERTEGIASESASTRRVKWSGEHHGAWAARQRRRGGREGQRRRLALAPALHREREHADRDPNPSVNMLVRQDVRRQPAGARVCRSAAAAH